MPRINDEKLIEALKVFAKEYIEELGDLLKKEDKIASGNLLKSLDSRIIKTSEGKNYKIEIIGEDYLQYVDQGRKSGKQPPLSAIKKWTRLKGINEKAAYPIARNIGKKGIKATNIIERTINNVNKKRNLRKFEDEYYDWVDDVVDQLLIDLSKGNKNIIVK